MMGSFGYGLGKTAFDLSPQSALYTVATGKNALDGTKSNRLLAAFNLIPGLSLDTKMVTTSAKISAEVIANAERMKHIFAIKHNIAPLVMAFGSQAKVVEAVSTAVAMSDKLPKSRVFEFFIQVAGKGVQVTGRVMNGSVRLSNFWIP